MINFLKIKVLFFVITILFSASPLQQLSAENVINFDDTKEVINLTSSLFIYEDVTNSIDFNEVISKDFLPIKQGVPNLGLSKSTFWIKFNLQNLSPERRLILKLSSPIIDKVEFFSPNWNGKYNSIKTGESYPFKTRKYQDPNFLFDLNIPNNQTITCYLKISSSEGIQVPISLGTEDVIFSQLKIIDIFSGIYMGIMLVMIFYNLFVYISVRDQSYLYYVFYILLILLVQTGLQGYFFQYLWFNSPGFSQYSTILFPSLVGIAGMVFMNVFLKVKDHYKNVHKITYVLSIFYLIPIITPFFDFYKIGYKALEINAGIVSLYMLIVTIMIVRKGFQPAKYFLVAWLIFLVGVICFILKDFGVLPFNNFTRYTMQIGSGIETVLLSFALAARINIYKKEKEESQKRAVEALKENEKIIKEQNVVLEQKVIERTDKLNEALNHLKKTQSQLVDSEKMSSLGQLTAGIAHEINNPINFVSSNIPPLRQDLDDLKSIMEKYEELNLSDNIPEKMKEIELLKNELDFEYLKSELNTIVNGIEDGAKRTTEIVSGLRNFSRLDEVELIKANINEGIETTMVLIKTKLNGIKIKLELGNFPDYECNPGKINQVVMNLVDNAIHAINSKDFNNSEGLITVITSQSDKTINITVKDNGVGIPEKDIANLFDPFFTTKDVGEGTGLGLSIVRGIIDNHNGNIIVDTEINVGTSISIELPIKNTDDGED